MRSTRCCTTGSASWPAQPRRQPLHRRPVLAGTIRPTSASSSSGWSIQCDVDRQILSSPWSFTFGGYLPEQGAAAEALCTVGNGYRATRGCAPEADAGPFHYRHLRRRSVQPAHRRGGRVRSRTRAWSTCRTGCRWNSATTATWFDIDSATTAVLRTWQNMDLRQAELTASSGSAIRAGAPARWPSAASRPCTCRTPAPGNQIVGRKIVGHHRIPVHGGRRRAQPGVERYRALSDDHLVATTTRELSRPTRCCGLPDRAIPHPDRGGRANTLWRGEEPLRLDSRFVDEPRRVATTTWSRCRRATRSPWRRWPPSSPAATTPSPSP